MEKDFFIKNGKIHFIINGYSERIALIVHGFTGSITEYIHQKASEILPRNGIATCRISLYNGKINGARKLDEVSLYDHVQDVNAVLDWLEERYEKVFLIGHSLGGVVAILSSQKAEKMVLWDPTAGFDRYEEKGFVWNDCLGKFVSYRRIPTIVSRELVEQWKEWKAEKLARKIRIPTKFIFAKRYDKFELWKNHLGIVSAEHEHVVIDAGHTFTEENAADKLMEETLKWIN